MISTLKEELGLVRDQKNQCDREIALKEKRLAKLEERLDSGNHKYKYTMSEHAMHRYLERFCKVDFNKFFEEVLTEDVKKAIDALGGTCTIPRDGYTLVVRNFVIVTITTDEKD